MRILVQGDCEAARDLRGRLLHLDNVVVIAQPPALEVTPFYTVTLATCKDTIITLDSVDSPLEANIYQFVAQHARCPVIIKRAAGSDRAIQITASEIGEIQEAVAEGVYTALGVLLRHAPPEPAAEVAPPAPEPGYWARAGAALRAWLW